MTLEFGMFCAYCFGRFVTIWILRAIECEELKWLKIGYRGWLLWVM
jgi:hypothetical protein